ncbi:MAG: DNA polymerase III subunit alpha, partial [Planctomycetota bacterium]
DRSWDRDIEAELAASKVPPPSHPAPARDLLEAARAVGVGAVAVPDVYHAYPNGARDHRVRVAIKHNALLCDLAPSWVAPAPAHLPTAAELRVLYANVSDVRGPWPASVSSEPPLVGRTLEVAERCEFVPPLGSVHFPEIELEPDETAYSRLCQAAFDGARRRYRPLRPEVVRRLDYELSAIDQLGFAPYFLLVKQIGDFAREKEIPCVGRGSAADSLVSYCTGLTDADPLRYRLPFERFLNPARKDRPDIDLDFCWRRRDEVIEHVYEAFGPERTAMISTINCFGLRAAFRETALVAGIPPVEVNRWSKRLPWSPPGSQDESEGATAVERAVRSTPECRDFPHDDERWQGVLRAADALLDTPRHFGLHPGGVVVSPGPITDFSACHRSAKGPVTTQLDKDAIEAVGLVKMDLLGNRALTTIDDCTRVLADRGIEVDLAGIPEDDASTASLLREGRSLGCFQVESPGMRNLLQQTGACTMDDVIQAVALIRPGPAGSGMKEAYVRRFRGLEEPQPPHPRLTELLWDTHGIMLYQEDVMQAATLLAVRRTLQKRGRPLGPLRERFLDGAQENGVERADAARVWELISNFVSFAFCKAHAVTYGRIAYRAVWLKAHYPAVYMAAFLASETGYYAARVYVEEARRLGVPILPPDINRSRETFSVEWVEHESGREQPCLRIGLRQL